MSTFTQNFRATQVLRAWNEGHRTAKDIMAATGLSPHTVYRSMRKHGLKRKPFTKPAVKRARDIVLEAIENGAESPQHAAQMCGIGTRTCQKWFALLRQDGIKAPMGKRGVKPGSGKRPAPAAPKKFEIKADPLVAAFFGRTK